MIAELFYLDTTIWAKTPYIKGFVSKLKERIPMEYRYWNKEERVWVINYFYEKVLITLCKEYFTDISYYGEKRYAIKAIKSSSNYETLHLLPNAPKEVIIAAYRALARLYHPDVSNEPNANEKMAKINVAFDEIMGRRKQ